MNLVCSCDSMSLEKLCAYVSELKDLKISLGFQSRYLLTVTLVLNTFGRTYSLRVKMTQNFLDITSIKQQDFPTNYQITKQPAHTLFASTQNPLKHDIFQPKIQQMPPKKVNQKSQGQETKPKKLQKQTKLFSSDIAEESTKNNKSKSKQFNGGTAGSTSDHTKMWEYGTGVTPNKLFISSWNVNGIRAVLNKKELQNYLEKVKPDILCLNETKIDFEAFQKEPIKLPGYHGYWNFCKCSAGYSGVAIFSKYLPISITQDLPQKQHSQEGRVITIEFEKFYLITAYIPNAGQKLDRLQYRVGDYDKCFQAYCNQLKNKKTVIICGDLNVCHKEIDIARPKGNEKTAGFTIEERDSFTKFLSTGWVDTFRKFYPDTVKYSWWSMRTGGRAKNIGWRLDYFLVDSKSVELVKDSQINNDIFGSDHCPIELNLELK